MASRVFEALVRQHQTKLRKIAHQLYNGQDFSVVVANWQAELRLAALLHDTGHSLHSHTSEQIYSKIPLLSEAAKELSQFTGATKGAGEVLSFCISRTDAVRNLLARAQSRLAEPDEDSAVVDLDNVALFIIGRSKYPQLQFLGDIISSDLDADKLDYLLRDATAAGLPLRYDLERYLYTVDITESALSDGEGALEKLYAAFDAKPEKYPATDDVKYPFYKAYKLQLPRQGINTIEQIIICKFMLFSYIYHHKKVRAAEGMLARLIRRAVKMWRERGSDDSALIRKFLQITDCALDGDVFRLQDDDIREYRERLAGRVLPRQVIGLSSNIDHDEKAKVSKFMADVLNPAHKQRVIDEFEAALGKELLRLVPGLAATPEAALTKAGVWLDVPRPPGFNKLEDLVIGPIKFIDLFPITSWIQAFISYRYHARVFAFSEYVKNVEQAVRVAFRQVVKIDDPNFVDLLARRSV